MKKRRPDESLIASIVGEDCFLKGDIETQHSIRIEGRIDGNIHAQGDVIVGQHSHIKGNILAKTITVSGEIIGNIEAIQGIHIVRTGRVYGDIKGDRLTIDEGGLYKGKVIMDILSSENRYEGAQTFARAT